MSRPIISLNMPLSFGREPKYETVVCFLTAGDGGNFQVEHVGHRSSLLTHNFNLLWANALNARQRDGVTHFAMIHDDVVPMAYKIHDRPINWLVHLFELMGAHDADLISVVIPIKGGAGKTSTALETSDPWNPIILDLETIYRDYGAVGTFTNDGLLVNTGLFLLRFDRIFEKHANFGGGPVPIFRQTDTVTFKDGRWKAETIPEDWDFSRQIRALGGKIFATVEIPVWHGDRLCNNCRPSDHSSPAASRLTSESQ